MQTSEIPYMPNAGAIGKILEKIKEAATPDTFNADFLGTKLGFKGGNNRMFISWAKKTGLLNNDGSPSQLYKQFRNSDTSKTSLAKALRHGYSELYSRNEYCHELDRNAFSGLVAEATGEPAKSGKLKMIVSTFFNAKALADFDAEPVKKDEKPESLTKIKDFDSEIIDKQIKLGLNYTINLTPPKTDDPSIYAAIFKALKENLLSN